MNNSGSPNAADKPESRRPSVWLIVVAVAFGLALIVGFNILRALYGLIAPPLPPLPSGMTEISHVSEAYGADVWGYTSADQPCAAAAYLVSQGGTCQYSPLQCTDSGIVPFTDFPTTIVARCHGGVSFSIFHMQWWAEILRDNRSNEMPTVLNLEREVFWIGTGPRDPASTSDATRSD